MLYKSRSQIRYMLFVVYYYYAIFGDNSQFIDQINVTLKLFDQHYQKKKKKKTIEVDLGTPNFAVNTTRPFLLSTLLFGVNDNNIIDNLK